MLVKTPIRASLYRPVLYGGVAPPWLFFEASAVFLLLFEAGLHMVTFALALVYVLAFHPLAVYLCARDPLIAELYVRSLRSADFYSAWGSFRCRIPPVDPALAGPA